MYTKTDARSAKILKILYGFCVAVVIIVARLFYLQIEQGVFFKAMGQHNCLRTEVILPLRGNLLDCNGVVLASNRPVYNLYWQGGAAGKLSSYHIALLKKLETIADRTFTSEEQLEALRQAERRASRVLLKADLTFQQLCQISEQCSNVASLVIENRFKRLYPFQALASHVLGYLSRVENIGRAGLESAVQDELEGQKGYRVHVINATGKTLEEKVCKEAIAGSNITLTLDYELQVAAENSFDEKQLGAFILMDPETGAIRSLVSHPNFDPNIFLESITQEEWQEKMVVNRPLLNRATCALYPPASPFKLVTYAAGIEEKLLDPTTVFDCQGHIMFCGRPYHCMRHTGHGCLIPRQALGVSCNIPCFMIAKRIKVDRLAMYAGWFGLGQKTDFLLPEKSGLVPTTMWKKTVKHERWWGGETLSMCIGQSSLLVTPLQVVRMVASICTGYLIKPRLLESEVIAKEPLKFKPETLKLLREGMKEAVNMGTGHIFSFISGFDVYAKTGTAQTCALDKEKRYKHQYEHAWVTGYFTYRGSKPLALVVLLENEGSSTIALQFVNKFLRKYREIKDPAYRPVVPPQEVAPASIVKKEDETHSLVPPDILGTSTEGTNAHAESTELGRDDKKDFIKKEEGYDASATTTKSCIH